MGNIGEMICDVIDVIFFVNWLIGNMYFYVFLIYDVKRRKVL